MVDGVNLTSIRPRGRGQALREAVFEVNTAVLSVAIGVVVIVDRVVPGLGSAGQLGSLPIPFAVVLGVLMVSGGVFVLASFLCRSRPLGDLMTMERVGVSLLGGGWAAFAAGILATTPEQIAGWTAPAIVVGSCMVRWTVVREEARRIRAATRSRSGPGDA